MDELKGDSRQESENDSEPAERMRYNQVHCRVTDSWVNGVTDF